jgi:hypothetical protein
MPTPKDFRRLNRHVLLSMIASLGVCLSGIIATTLYFQPTLVIGITETTASDYEGKIIWLLSGLLFIAMGFFFCFILIWWPYMLKKIVRESPPRIMTLELKVQEDSESTTYFAVLHENMAIAKTSSPIEATIWVHPPKLRRDVGQCFSAQVFFHPQHHYPVAVEYQRGMLWLMAGGSRKGQGMESTQKFL